MIRTVTKCDCTGRITSSETIAKKGGGRKLSAGSGVEVEIAVLDVPELNPSDALAFEGDTATASEITSLATEMKASVQDSIELAVQGTFLGTGVAVDQAVISTASTSSTGAGGTPTATGVASTPKVTNTPNVGATPQAAGFGRCHGGNNQPPCSP